MYLHIGKEKTIPTKNIIGIFDLESTTISKVSKDFLREAEQEGFVENISTEIPKTFIVTEEKNRAKIYFSNISSGTLQKRTFNFKNFR